jgi:gluconokinase
MVIILMGVAGSGKSTIGLLLAQELQWDFYDADDFHPPGNINKMRRGLALNDDDRLPWLLELQKVIGAWLSGGKNTILACSALKVEYRRMLIQDPMNMRLVYLRGDVGLLEHRVRERKDHFLSNELLPSQFTALEEPADALIVDVDRSPAEIVKQITDTWEI